MNLRRIVFLAVLISLLCVPALAGVKYLTGEPDLSAAIQGRNEFYPGEDVTLQVTIENRGLVEMKFVQSTIIEREDMPNTAKLVRATLGAGDSPLIVKADPQAVGDIPGGKTVTVSFAAKIPADAPAGNYTLPLLVQYSYLKAAEQYGQDAISYSYSDMEKTVPLTVRVQPRAMLEVISVKCENLNAGTEGYLVLSVRNGATRTHGTPSSTSPATATAPSSRRTAISTSGNSHREHPRRQVPGICLQAGKRRHVPCRPLLQVYRYGR